MMKYRFISLLFFSTLILSACSNPFDQLADEINSWISGDEPTEETTNDEPNDNSTQDTSSSETETSTNEDIDYIDYSHLMNEGAAVSLDKGTHSVGSDIEPGRYKVIPHEETSSISVENAEGRIVAGETLSGLNKHEGQYPDSLVVFLDEGYTLETQHDSGVELEPYETSDIDVLTTGLWVVGEDIPEGVYDITVPNTDKYGSLSVSNVVDYDKMQIIIGSEQYGGTSEFTISFDDGDVLNLRYLPNIELVKR